MDETGTMRIESGGVVRSPNGQVEVELLSTTYPNGQAVTQVMASYKATGSGLIAVHARCVNMRIEWLDDRNLVISYPAGSSPTSLHNKQVAGARVEYRPVPAHDIPAIEWLVVSQQVVTTSSEPQARGSIITRTTDEHTTYGYFYYDSSEADSHAPQLRAKGYQGGGDTWAGIVYGLLQLHAPGLYSKVELDPEGGGLVVWSEDREALLRLAELVAAAKDNDVLLEAAIQRALQDNRME